MCADESHEENVLIQQFPLQEKEAETKKKKKTMASVLSEIALDEVAYIELLRKLIGVAVRYIRTCEREEKSQGGFMNGERSPLDCVSLLCVCV